MRVAICDDENDVLDYLDTKINQFLKDQNEMVNITRFSSAEEMLFKCGDSFPFDLVILDIQMGEINGMELAKKIRLNDKEIHIAFLTGDQSYVFDGYEVGAIRYLLKPLKETQLFTVLKEVNDYLNLKEKRTIILTINREKVKIYLEDIFYIESLGHYVVIHTKKETYEMKKALSEMVEELACDDFIYTHRSFVVNLKHVDKITKDYCLLSNDTLVSVSRGQYQQVNEQFIAYYRRGLEDV